MMAIILYLSGNKANIKNKINGENKKKFCFSFCEILYVGIVLNN